MKRAITDKETLIQELIRGKYLRTPAIIEAFRRIDRKDFVLPEYAAEAYGNYPLPIGFGQTISQPLTVAFMLELLQPQPGERVLEIGAGSGWTAALIADIVSQNGKKPGKVIAIERLEELQKMASRNIAKYDFVSGGAVEVYWGDGTKGYPDAAPFHKIIAAAAGEAVPPAWKEQLRTRGRIVAPVKNTIEVWEKAGTGDFRMKEYYGFSFVPLIGDEGGDGGSG
ncbi:MAG: protein-L-isoaspartate O-methyltransferase [Patescibacteria group bacterium]